MRVLPTRAPRPLGDGRPARRGDGEAPDAALSGDLDRDRKRLARRLGHGESFDMLFHPFRVGRRRALLITIDGFFKDDILLRITQFLLAQPEGTPLQASLARLYEAGVAYAESGPVGDEAAVVDAVLAGQAALLVDGVAGAVLIDERTYPSRKPDEPELEKVVRGPRDGLTETLIFNTALIRRRVRDPGLRFQLLQVGRRARADVALAYIKDVTPRRTVDLVRRRLRAIDVDGLPAAEKSLEEFLVPEKRWWNPFPTVRYSERPDVVAAHLLEGHVAVLTDTSPSVMLLPVTFFHHLQHAQEYHEESVTGAFLRAIRITGFLIAWIGPPLWLALALSPDLLPPALGFIGPKQANAVVPLGLQFVLAELSANLVWVALIHTPNALSTSLGLIGAVLIGQQAVQVGLFSPEALLYTAAAFIGTFATPSLELGNAIRALRTLLLVLTALGRLPAFVAGALLSLVLLVRTRSFGIPYLYPLWPFRGRDLINVLVRRPHPARHFRPRFTHPRDPDVRAGPSRR